MDITTVAGLLIGFGSLIGAILIEGKGDFREIIPFFTNYSAFAIIFGGTLGATIVGAKKQDVARIGKVFVILFKEVHIDHIGVIGTITSLAEKARREGLISLESDIPNIENPMLAKGLQLVIDGTDPEQVEAILQTNLVQQKNDAAGDATLFETLGGFAPTMGVVGAVMGLVGALKRMGTAGMTETVQSIAVAFIATFWGIGSANLIFLPLCNKIRARWRDQLILGQIIVEGIISIQAGNNPHIVRDRLMSFLSIEEANAANEAAAAAKK